MTLVQVNRIIEAVKFAVPQEMLVDLVHKLDQPEQHPETLDVETDAVDDVRDRAELAVLEDELRHQSIG